MPNPGWFAAKHQAKIAVEHQGNKAAQNVPLPGEIERAVEDVIRALRADEGAREKPLRSSDRCS